MSQQGLEAVDSTINFVKMEEKVLQFWKEIDAFRTSLKKSEGKKPYTFYDGPPFATGLPHYGHILAGTIKDVVTRYAHQTGHHVERRAGWDCHGLPIEFEIEKQLGIKTSDDVLKFGIGNYNEECRKIVMRYAGEWDKTVTRLGRWIDFENDYKTMNKDFMESVWWVFGQLYKKGLVYRGFKVMPYSVGCTTPLSNFEANSNYQDVYDPAVTVSFPLLDGDNGETLDPADPQTPHMVAWTTTPWTLPSNLTLCLNPTLDYIKVRDVNTNKVYIVAEARIVELYKPKKKSAKKGDAPKDYEVLAKYKGSDLKGRRYKPLFDYYAREAEFADKAFRIVVDGYVTSDSGTGVVHCAPGFGEDDYRVCMENGIITKGGSLPCPVDANGRFTSPVEEYKGLFVKDADNAILEKLKEDGRLIAKGSIKHSYPFCFSPDTRVLMFDGSVRAIVDVKMGDKLYGDDGTSRTVIDLIPRQSGQMYVVRQSNGDTYYVNGNHILVVKTQTSMHLSEGDLNEVQYYRRCNADSCKSDCGGMHRTVKSFSTAEEAKTAMINPMEYLPGYVADGTIFEITVQQWLNLCAPDVRENFRGFRVPHPVQENEMSKDSFTSTITVEETDERNEFCGVTVDGNERFLLEDCTVVHNCWRSDTPLIYRAIPSWFVSVESIKDRLLTSNEDTYWVPEFVKSKRFHNWLEDARDWAISRTRYWGTPIPLWVSEDWEEIVCVSSAEELSQLTGKPLDEITDIHRHHVDDLTIPSKRPNQPPLRRVPDVLDCWFESGSMPYAQMHYPFENVEKFENAFPASFIAEGIDQCRGWFYTLLVLGTALFDKSPFTNVIVNGLVLASDGKKMSKRLKNYPDPTHVIDAYGADALRLYLINSPVVRAAPLKFMESGVKDVVKDLFIPWYNAYRFFVQQAIAFQKEHNQLFTSRDAAELRSTNVMDQWMSSLVQSLVKFVRDEMQAYRLYTVVPKLLHNIDQLTNWYVRMNRKRLKGDEGKEDWYQSLCTLYTVLLTITRTMAPFTPFLTESMYQNLKTLIPEDEREDSVHYLMIPEYDESRVNVDIERAVEHMQQVVEVGRTIRDRKGIGLKTPLREAIVCHMDTVYLQELKDLEVYICEELNTKQLQTTSELKSFLNLSASPNKKSLGTRFKKEMNVVSDAIAKLTHEECVQYVETGKITILGAHELSGDDIFISKHFTGDVNKYESQITSDNSLVILNHVLDDELKQEGMSRVMTSTVQQLRKKAGLVPEDNIDVYFEVQSDENGQLVRDVTQKYESLLSQSMKNMSLQTKNAPTDSKVIIRSKEDVTGTGALIDVVLTWQE